MLKKKVVVVISEKMDSNKNPERNEDTLVRMSKKVRQSLHPKDKTIELYDPNGNGIDRTKYGRLLDVHQAYSSDLKALNGLVKKGILTEKDKARTCFVSSKTFKNIRGKTAPLTEGVAKFWVADCIADVVVGADPEFALIASDGRVPFAHDYIRGWTAPLGPDESGRQAEVRPQPEVCPEKLVKNMMQILKKDKNAELIKSLTWLACSYVASHNWPYGGHIHIGTPKLLEKSKLKPMFFVVATRVLDELIALPLSKIEGEGGEHRRSRTRFGKHGDFRRSAGRLEWRVPGGDFMAHPDIALATIGAAKAVSEEILHMIDASGYTADFVIPKRYRGGNFKGFDDPAVNEDWGGRIHFFHGRDFNYNDRRTLDWADFPACEAFGLGMSSAELARKLHRAEVSTGDQKRIFRTLRRMSTYRDYRKMVDKFIDICSNSKKTFDKLERDMRETWVKGKKMFK